jgi:UDP:flavonoid glycosyltransferase YjiC (YdhE family)
VTSAGIRLVLNHPGLLSHVPIGVLPPAHDLPLPLSGRSVHEIDCLSRLFQPLRHWAAARMTSSGWRRILEPRRCSRGLAPLDFRRHLADTLILVNSAFGLEYGRPLPPLVQMVGPMLPADDAHLAPQDAAWLADGPPVAYVNLGTLAAPSPELFCRLAEGLRSDAFRALWVVRPGLLPTLPPDLPATVRVESWVASPYAALRHPNVRAFVSHCGINSAYESLAAGTPIVGIPLFADQQDMALQVRDAGVGVLLRKDRFTPAELRESVTRIIRDEAFRLPIPAIRSSFNLAGGARRAADLIEHAERVGTDHYRTDLPPRRRKL